MFTGISNEQGYTLLELLVAIALMTLMIVPLSGGVKLGLDTWQFSHEQISIGEKKYLLRLRIRDWLAAAYPLDMNRRPSNIVYPMVGTTEELTFSAAIHPDPSKNELSRLMLRRTTEGVFQLGLKPDAAALDPVQEMVWHDLMEDVASIEFSYMEGLDQQGSAIWLTNWEAQAQLPAAVRLKLDFGGEDKTWVPLIARPNIDEWAFCVLDPVSGNCRTGEIAG